jgi:hypothetical protein
MKNIFICLLVLCCTKAISQTRAFTTEDEKSIYDKIYEAKYVEKPPIFTFGADSCRRFYFTHFGGFDSVLNTAVSKGDTAEYIRIYFSFVVDKRGVPYDAKFERIASAESPRTPNAKTIRYFAEDKKYYDQPATQNMQPVECKMDDFLQFWVGINPPKS